MQLLLVRHTFTANSTISSLAVDGVFQCFCLEPPLVPNPLLGPDHIAIPYGTFPVVVRKSARFGRNVLGLENVPGRTDIEIHPGNTSVDTHGCILPGSSRSIDFVGGSDAAEAALYTKVAGAIYQGESVTIEIIPSQAGSN